MAIVAYSQRDTKVGIAAQTTWGTAIADNAAFVEMDVEPIVIDRDIKIRKGYGNHATRVAESGDVIVDQYGVTPKFSMKGLCMNDYLSHLLYNFFQSVSEGASTPYAKTFIYHATNPDFSANAGHFFTLCNRAPNASVSEKITDCICQSLELSIEPGGDLMFSGNYIGRGAVNIASNPSGTWTRALKATTGTPNYWSYANQLRHTANFGAGAVSLVLTGGWKVVFEQDVIPVGQSGTGNIQTFALSNKRGKFTGKILWDANSASAITNLVAGTATTINIGFGNATAGTVNRDLDLTLIGKFTKVDRSNEEVFGVDFEMDLLGNIVTSTAAVSIIHADAGAADPGGSW